VGLVETTSNTKFFENKTHSAETEGYRAIMLGVGKVERDRIRSHLTEERVEDLQRKFACRGLQRRSRVKGYEEVVVRESKKFRVSRRRWGFGESGAGKNNWENDVSNQQSRIWEKNERNC